jgi:hypothetical protein
VEFTALIHEEDRSYWAEVKEALVEAIQLCLEDGPHGTPSAHVDQMRVLVPT